MASLPSSVAAPPSDLSDLDKLTDKEVEELYFDTLNELKDTAQFFWMQLIE